MVPLTKKMKRDFNVLLILFLLSLWLGSVSAEAAGTKATAGREKRVVTFVYFPTAVPVAVLGETMKRDRVLQKALEREGYRIEFRTFGKGPEAFPLIRQKRVDAILFSDMPSIEAVSTGEMLIVGTVKRSYASVVARNGTMLEHLRRKKIGNLFGTTSHYALLQALDSVRLTEQEVAITQMELTQMPDALAQGKIDAFAAWEPIPTAALKKYPGQFNVIHRQVSLSYFLLSRQMVTDKPAVADAFSAALIRAIRWMKKGNNLFTASRWALDGMQEFTGKSATVSVADIAGITRSDLLDVPAVPLISASEKDAASALGREFDFLQAIGKLPAQASRGHFLPAIRPDFLPRLLARHAYYQLNTFDYAP